MKKLYDYWGTHSTIKPCWLLHRVGYGVLNLFLGWHFRELDSNERLASQVHWYKALGEERLRKLDLKTKELNEHLAYFGEMPKVTLMHDLPTAHPMYYKFMEEDV